MIGLNDLKVLTLRQKIQSLSIQHAELGAVCINAVDKSQLHCLRPHCVI